jgi:hypothetical protein
MTKLKTILFTGILPAAAGVWCGALYHPILKNAATGSTASAITTRASKLPPDPNTTTPPLTAPFSATPDPNDGPPESVKDRINTLARTTRVEDLLAELDHLPPGDDRNLAIGLLAEHWFTLDHAATTAWITSLKNDGEKERAYCGLMPAWAQEDSEAASTWLADLPEGSLKQQAGASLATALTHRDPAAALSWGIACRNGGLDQAALESIAGSLGYYDSEEAERIVAISDLLEDQKRALRNAARQNWNRMRAVRGEWDKIRPLETTLP